MTTYFHVALGGTARSWLMNLPPGSVSSWSELCQQYVTDFSRLFTRSGMRGDLLAVRQRKGEMLRQYIQRFI